MKVLKTPNPISDPSPSRETQMKNGMEKLPRFDFGVAWQIGGVHLRDSSFDRRWRLNAERKTRRECEEWGSSGRKRRGVGFGEKHEGIEFGRKGADAFVQ